MIAIVVLFEIKPERADSFREGMRRQARICLEREPGCHQFDVCVDADDPTSILIYEIFDDEAAVAHHNDTPHFHEFRALVKDWIVKRRLLKFVRLPAGAAH